MQYIQRPEMTLIYFTWEDGLTSCKAFADNGDFYAYMEEMEEEGHFPEKIECENQEWCLDGYYNSKKQRVDIDIIWK